MNINHELDWIPVRYQLLGIVKHLTEYLYVIPSRRKSDGQLVEKYDPIDSMISHIKSGNYSLLSRVESTFEEEFSSVFQQAYEIHKDATHQIRTPMSKGAGFVELVSLAYQYPVLLEIKHQKIPSDAFLEWLKIMSRPLIPPLQQESNWTPNMLSTHFTTPKNWSTISGEIHGLKA